MNDDIKKLQHLAEEIRVDFETIMIPEMPFYKEGPRYLELMKMIEELKIGKLEDHKYFNYYASMDTDELTGHKELMFKVDNFTHAFQRLFKAQKELS